MNDKLIKSVRDFCKYDHCTGKHDINICKDCWNGGNPVEQAPSRRWLPCKMGQEVYWINRVKNKIETDRVIAIHFYEDGNVIITTSNNERKEVTSYSLNRFLEIMHLNKEEALHACACDEKTE